MKTNVSFEKQSKETQQWLTEIAEQMDVPKRKDWAYSALKAVLHTIRDRTTLQEVFHLSAQLPVLIRGIFLESYSPTGKPLKMNAEQFIRMIRDQMGAGVEVSEIEAFRAVITVLYQKVSPGELNDIKGSMPKSIQRLWDFTPLEEMNSSKHEQYSQINSAEELN